MTKVEEVARALCAVWVERNGLEYEVLPWEDLAQDERDTFLSDARAAIAAMREPSEEMLNEGCGPDSPMRTVCRCSFAAMIDAALEEQA